MRPIGIIEGEGHAQEFGRFLSANGIENQIEKQAGGGWEVWVLEEDKLDIARQYLTEFRANPDAEKFRQAKLAVAERKLLAARAPGRQARVFNRGGVFSGAAFRVVSLSTALIGVSIVIAVATQLGRDDSVVSLLTISGFTVEGDSVSWVTGLPEIRHGQVWRLITPIFVHFSILHLLFNMLWLRDLGSLIEARASTLKLLLLVLVTGIASNIGQYLMSGPSFGGMSGVVYGLFGYIWMRGKFDPSSGMFLTDQTIMIMVGWYLLCLTGIIGSIANTAHTVGLVLGMGIGYLTARIRPVGFRRGR